MKKQIFGCFLSLLASVLMVRMAKAENSATFTLFTPRYFVDGQMVANSPSFILGQRGAFTSFESFPVQAIYSVDSGALPEGYYVSKWVLSKSWGAGLSGKEIQTQSGGTSFSITFDYKWAAKYGTALDLTVYLEPITYTLKYDANGGGWTAGEPEGGEYAGNDSVTAPDEDAVERENYTLTGWKSGSSGTLVEPGETFTGTKLGVSVKGQKVTLYAQWGKAKYKVTLNNDGGTIAKGKNVTFYEYGVGATLPTLTKTNCKFEGWYDNPLFSSNVVTAISKTDSGDKEFWAKFVQQDTVVHYNGNGATSGTMADSVFAFDTPAALTANAFKRSYVVTYNANGGSASKSSDTATYAFRNWNNKPNGQGDYTYGDRQDVTNPCGSTGEAVTLYALWNDEPVAVALPEATCPGKVFGGWYAAQTGGVRVGGAGDAYEPAREITLYAHWGNESTCTIRFSPNATVTNPSAMDEYNKNQKVDEAISLPECAYQNLAATKFLGWKYGDTIYTPGAKFIPKSLEVGSGEAIVFKAQWKNEDPDGLGAAVGLDNAVLTNVTRTAEAKDLAWKPYADGGIECKTKNNTRMSMVVVGTGRIRFSMELSSKKAALCRCDVSGDLTSFGVTDGYEIKEVIVGESKKAQYVITWWVDWADASSPAECRIKDMTWIPDDASRTITATPEGSAMGGGTYNIGDTAKLTAAPGDTFKRWNDGSTANPYSVKVTCDETYEAIFSGGSGDVPCYYVLFNGNGAGNLSAMDGQQMPCGVATALTANKFTRSGFKFAGWATARNGAVVYADKAAVNLSSTENDTKTLYAVWEASSTPTPGPTPGPEPEPEPGVYESVVGETVVVDLAADYPDETIKSVSGLPTGLKYNKTTGLVTGTPTKAVSKEDNVKITFADKTTTKATWTVAALPAMMVGTYYGAAFVDGLAGQFQLKLAATGKATGYFYAAGKKISFKSTALVGEDDDRFAVAVSYTFNRVKYADEFVLARAATVDDTDLWSASLGEASEVLEDLDARRDTIKEVFGKVVPKTTTYDVMEKTEEGEYLKAKVTTAGAVTVSGKLMSDAGKLTSVSCSTHLVVGDDGEAYCYITIYKTVSKSEPIVYEERWELPE